MHGFEGVVGGAVRQCIKVQRVDHIGGVHRRRGGAPLRIVVALDKIEIADGRGALRKVFLDLAVDKIVTDIQAEHGHQSELLHGGVLIETADVQIPRTHITGGAQRHDDYDGVDYHRQHAGSDLEQRGRAARRAKPSAENDVQNHGEPQRHDVDDVVPRRCQGVDSEIAHRFTGHGQLIQIVKGAGENAGIDHLGGQHGGGKRQKADGDTVVHLLAKQRAQQIDDGRSGQRKPENVKKTATEEAFDRCRAEYQLHPQKRYRQKRDESPVGSFFALRHVPNRFARFGCFTMPHILHTVSPFLVEICRISAY